MLKKSISSILLLHIIFSVYSCNDNSINISSNTNVVTSLSGSIEGLPVHLKKLKARLVGDSSEFIAGNQELGDNNVISLELISTPPPSVLKGLNELLPQLSGVNELNYSDPSAKTNHVRINMYNSNNEPTGSLIKINSIGHLQHEQGDFQIYYFYCDRNTTVSGTSYSVFNSDTNKRSIDLNFGVGYNRVIRVYKTIRKNFTEINTYSGDESGGIWYYTGPLSD